MSLLFVTHSDELANYATLAILSILLCIEMMRARAYSDPPICCHRRFAKQINFLIKFLELPFLHWLNAKDKKKRLVNLNLTTTNARDIQKLSPRNLFTFSLRHVACSTFFANWKQLSSQKLPNRTLSHKIPLNHNLHVYILHRCCHFIEIEKKNSEQKTFLVKIPWHWGRAVAVFWI